jgi:hypothetical protein
MHRRQVYALLITISLAVVCSRILSTVRNYEPYLFRDDAKQEYGDREMRPVWPKTRPEPVPTFSSNDRSRWATARALVDNGTYVIGYREVDPVTGKYRDYGIIFEDGWQSIDRVLHPEHVPGQPNTYRFYSSKPPLFPTLMAGEYWLLKRVFGLSLDDSSKWSVFRIGLLTFNALPLLIYLVLLSRLVERFGTSDWGRLFVMAAACFGTFVTLFAITINNHSLAACTALFALYPALRIWAPSNPDAVGFANGVTEKQEEGETGRQGDREADGQHEGDTGVTPAALSASLQPSVSPSPGLPVSPSAGPSVSVSAALRPASWCLFLLCGFFAGFTAAIELPATAFAVALLAILLWRDWQRTLLFFVPAAAIPVAGFFVTNYLAIERWTPAYGEFGGPWYEFEGSVWKRDPNKEPRGIDWAGTKESRLTYAFNLLLGHHGLFSLTPIVLFAVAGMYVGLARLRRKNDGLTGGLRPSAHQLIAGLTLYLTVVVTGFYMVKTTNYGGWSNGPRWLMWLTPFWLLTMVPVVDWLAGKRWGRALGLAFLAISVFSVSYRDWNPWRHPWIYQVFDAVGWIPY